MQNNNHNIHKGEYKTKASQLDALYAFRENKKYLTLRLYSTVYAKLLTLCKFCGNKNSGKGSTFRSIITSLVIDEHIASNVDIKLMGLLKKHEGLLKHAANTFQVNLNINPAMLLIVEALNKIHDKAEQRREHKISNLFDDGKSHKVGVYFDEEQYAVLIQKSGGTNFSSFIRQLIKDKEITSRFTPDDYFTLDNVGEKIATAVRNEQFRRESRPADSPDESIAVRLSD